MRIKITVAEFRRRLAIGSKVLVTYLGQPVLVHGNAGTVVFPTPDPQVRTVTKFNATDLVTKKPDGTDVYCPLRRIEVMETAEGFEVATPPGAPPHVRYTLQQ
jgi:hypothetical protein